MRRLSRIISLVAALMMANTVLVRAQFVLSGNDPASVKWHSIQTEKYKVVYPAGCDSLAKVYLDALENFRTKDAASLKMIEGERQKKPLEVILHTRNAASNGSVTWTPSRMELYTVPQWNNPDPLPWNTVLAVHEGRHAAQMQNGYRKVFGVLYYVMGEIMPSFAQIYPGTLLLEGDAVVAETALTNGGRGREAGFLGYYWYCLDNGDWRNWMRWRLGSYYKYTPDHYAFGYLLLSGLRTKYDAPLFMADYFDYVSRRPYDPWPLRHTVRRNTGVKFNRGVDYVLGYHYYLWSMECRARGPFTPQHTLLARPVKRLTEYDVPIAASGEYTIWKKRDLYHLPSIVGIDSTGREKRIADIPSYSGRPRLALGGNTLYWNELRKDCRWDQVKHSVIMKHDLRSGRTSRIRLPKGNWIQPDEFSDSVITSIRYYENGGAAISFINVSSRRITSEWAVPDGIQPVQTTATGGRIYVAGIAEGGYGIWCVEDGIWKDVLAAQPVSITSLDHTAEGMITFSSDRNGVNEYYSLDPETGELLQLTNTRYGGTAYAGAGKGDIVFSQYNTNGTRPMVIKAADVEAKQVQWSDVHRYTVADKLSQQERELEAYGNVSDSTETDLTPKRYRKGAHAIRFHSWAPAYVDIDNIDNISFNNIQHAANLGAMGFFQNTMSTLSGYVGYKAEQRSKGNWLHSGHLSLTYSGLYPVFELKAQVGDGRAQHGYYNEKRDTLFIQTTNKPYASASLTTYVPLSWNRGHWNFGVIPQVMLFASNNSIENTYNIDVHAGVRAYAVQSTPSACVYPRWGIGAEAQYVGNLSYFYMYGYVPGICCGQGLRLSGIYQIKSTGLSPFINSYANLFPRGFTASNPYTGAKLTAEYAIPFNMGDWHIFDMLYCTRGIITPHFDWSYFTAAKGDLFSVGASFEMEFGCFFWIKTPTTVGVTASYNGGSLRESAKPYYVGALFKINLPNRF